MLSLYLYSLHLHRDKVGFADRLFGRVAPASASVTAAVPHLLGRSSLSLVTIIVRREGTGFSRRLHRGSFHDVGAALPALVGVPHLAPPLLLHLVPV